jgi:surfeit locus 1 family protein
MRVLLASSLRFGRFQFSPTLPSTLVTLLLLPLFAALGFWQLGRAQQKLALEALYAERVRDAPVRLERHVTEPSGLQYRSVELSGRFDTAHTILWDNRVYRGQAGYQVITPFQVQPTGLWVLVNRGWIPMGASRSELPRVETAQRAVELRGTISPPPEKTLTLGAEEASGWPKVVQVLDIDALSRSVGHELEPLVILLDPGSHEGFVRDWPAARAGAERHFAYAFQWFSMAFGLSLVYLLINTRRMSPGP